MRGIPTNINWEIHMQPFKEKKRYLARQCEICGAKSKKYSEG
jgi:hypothetical protein